MKKIILGIDGMSCSGCSSGLEKYLNKQDGIIEASVNLVMASASITYEEKLSVDDLKKFVEDVGFKATEKVNLDSKKKVNFRKLVLYGILGFLIMYVSMASMLKLPILSILNMHSNPKIYSTFLLILTILFLFYGREILINGIKNLFNKIPNMDTLVSIGVISSFTFSLVNTCLVLLGHTYFVHSLYFESTAFVIYFIKLGRIIDDNSKEKTRQAIKNLVTITPKIAYLKTKDGEKKVTIDEIKKDDIIICKPGEKIAVDGVIIKGKTHTDESFITGESKPVSKRINDKVIAGSINYDGVILYEAKKIGKDSAISNIVNLVVEATNTKAPISLLADKISGYFVPVILFISVLTFIISLINGLSLNKSLIRFVSVLTVACPCALGLATPLAIVVSEGNCAKKGILVKNSKVFEEINKIDTICFDKTGTLTNGKLNITKIFNYSKVSDDEILEILGNIEKNSLHPIALAIMNEINKKKINCNNDFKITNLDGLGIKGLYDHNTYYACNSKLISKQQILNTHKDDEEKLIKNNNSIVYLVKNDKIIALLGLKDTLRNDLKNIIEDLQNQKKHLIIISGDNDETVKNISKNLGINEFYSNKLPSEKLDIIKKLQNDGKKVMMVGDGINDAPSLALANIGVSISGATDVATDSASVILLNNRLDTLVTLFKISKKTLINIKQNLFWAFIYNIVMIPVAMGLFTKFNIEINPMIACLSMILSSLFVIFNALRLRKI